MLMANEQLLPDERQFAESNIKILHGFMKRYGLSQEYYGRLAVLFTRTVARYLRDPKFQGLSFSTVVWPRLRTELSNAMREQLQEPEIVPFEESHYGDMCLDEYENLLRDMVEQKLTPRQKQVFQMRLDGKTNAEIAEECGISRSAVEHLFARLRMRLREIFL